MGQESMFYVHHLGNLPPLLANEQLLFELIPDTQSARPYEDLREQSQLPPATRIIHRS